MSIVQPWRLANRGPSRSGRLGRAVHPKPGLRAQLPPPPGRRADRLRPRYLVDLPPAGVAACDRLPVLGLRALQGVDDRHPPTLAGTAAAGAGRLAQRGRRGRLPHQAGAPGSRGGRVVLRRPCDRCGTRRRRVADPARPGNRSCRLGSRTAHRARRQARGEIAEQPAGGRRGGPAPRARSCLTWRDRASRFYGTHLATCQLAKSMWWGGIVSSP
jgi:hypothetical protein